MYADISGLRFGRLVATAVVAFHCFPHGRTVPVWGCVCDCGRQTKSIASSLKSGNTRSCGCLSVEVSRLRKTRLTHGESKRAREYRAWGHAKNRCCNPKNAKYPLYGARGIKICDRWRNSYETFLADMGRAPTGMTLDRIDVNGDYEPGNCRWATPLEQSRNRRSHRLVTYQGKTICLGEFAALIGAKPGWVRYRLETGRSAEAIAELAVASR